MSTPKNSDPAANFPKTPTGRPDGATPPLPTPPAIGPSPFTDRSDLGRLITNPGNATVADLLDAIKRGRS